MIRIICWLITIPTICGVFGYKGAEMGVLTDCDDGQRNLTVDWPDFHYSAFTCDADDVPVNKTVIPLYYEIPGLDPEQDVVYHACMNEKLVYNMTPPLRGDHRPNWAKYGEYLYVPEQRWLHNLEHGSVVMLYHPCSNPHEVNKLRNLVTSCLYRHIITPYRKLSIHRPLALVTWGHKLEMNSVNVEAAVAFMRENAHRAPEDLFKQGKYDLHLIREAIVVTDKNDTQVCAWADSKKIDSNNFAYFDKQGVKSWVSEDTGKSERSKRQIGADPVYDRIYLEQLHNSNGPKFAQDVLPPSAILQQYNMPHYVMAGSYLGGDPQNPKVAPPKLEENSVQQQGRQYPQQLPTVLQQQPTAYYAMKSYYSRLNSQAAAAASSNQPANSQQGLLYNPFAQYMKYSQGYGPSYGTQVKQHVAVANGKNVEEANEVKPTAVQLKTILMRLMLERLMGNGGRSSNG